MQFKWIKTTRLPLIDGAFPAEAPQTPVPAVQSAGGGPQFKWPLTSRHGMQTPVEAAQAEPAQNLWPDLSPAKRTAQFKEPLTSWHGIPPAEKAERTAQNPLARREVANEVRQFKAPPAPRVPPAHGDPRLRQQTARYANWLAKQEKHDALHDHVEEINDYRQNATKVVKAGEQEVATFAPFRGELSALQTFTSGQAAVFCVITVLWIIGIIVLRLEMLSAGIAVITLIYCGNLLLNVLMASRSLRHLAEEKIDAAIVHALKDADWPHYTILCPLYREARVVPQFVEAMRRLDYPAEKLEVLFLTEVDDAETRNAIQALSPPLRFKIVTVPDGKPRTKPRACNYGLLQARGPYIVIYDAEDIQNQQKIDSMSNMSGERLASPNERQSNTDPREQTPAQEYTSRSSKEGHEQGYEQGYTGLDERDFWLRDGEKLRPEPKNQKGMGGLLALIVLLCASFIAGSFFGVILSWLTWGVVIVLIIAALAALATNWRVVTIPMSTRTFQIMEHARLVINTGAGAVAIRRGEEGMVSVTATKRASGIGIDTERMQINYNQYGDVLDISSRMAWSIFQFDLRTGGGRIEAQHLQGQINLHTGGSPIILGNTRGQLTTETGGGRIEVSQAALSGESSLKTGGGSITFDGSLDTLGSYNFRTGGGKVNLRLPGDAAFSLDTKTGGGGIHIHRA